MKKFENLTVAEVQQLHKDIKYFQETLSPRTTEQSRQYEKQDNTHKYNTHKCIYCCSENVYINGQISYTGTNGKIYTVNDYYCNNCGLVHQA